MASIRAFGRYLPERRVGNEEIAERLSCSPEWIREMSGIRERRFAADQETVISMATQAAQDCLKRAAMTAGDVKLLIVSSASHPRRFPGPAASVAKALGLVLPAIDLPIASAGALFALVLASQLAPAYGPVLVVASERMSAPAMSEPLDKNVAILFGDGAGACLVTPGDAGLKIIDHVVYSDGSFADDLSLENGGPIRMNGRTVILQASRKIPAAIMELLDRNHVLVSAVNVFLMHQANQNLIERVAKLVGAPAQRFYSNIERYGNTSSASMLIAASEWQEQHTPAPGENVCFATFGAGFHWGALLARVVSPKASPRRIVPRE